MAITIRYRVPYEVKVNASDLKSGKLVSNILYYRNDIQSAGSALAYGDPIPGSDLHGFLNSVDSMWTSATTGPCAALSVNYQISSFVGRAIIGRRYGTPLLALSGVAPGLTFTSVTTASSHGLSVGRTVQISGVTGPSGLNGTWTVLSVPSSTEFTVAFVFTGSWTLDGTAQKVQGQQEFSYSDKDEVLDTDLGQISGEALPLYCTCSMRRINPGTGRNWKSRISLSPLGESQQLNGKFTSAANTLFATVAGSLQTSLSNSGTGVGNASNMLPAVVSKQLAFLQPTPFTSSVTWCLDNTSFAARLNLGSFTRRKPKLTAVIS